MPGPLRYLIALIAHVDATPDLGVKAGIPVRHCCPGCKATSESIIVRAGAFVYCLVCGHSV